MQPAWPLWATLLGGALLLFPIQGTLDPLQEEELDLLRTLPPRQVLPLLAFGHPETAADLLEIQATNFGPAQDDSGPGGGAAPGREDS